MSSISSVLCIFPSFLSQYISISHRIYSGFNSSLCYILLLSDYKPMIIIFLCILFSKAQIQHCSQFLLEPKPNLCSCISAHSSHIFSFSLWSFLVTKYFVMILFTLFYFLFLAGCHDYILVLKSNSNVNLSINHFYIPLIKMIICVYFHCLNFYYRLFLNCLLIFPQSGIVNSWKTEFL